MTPTLYDYLRNISLREIPILKKCREKTYTMSMKQMQISPEQGQFMRLLIELMGAKKTLDIGVFTGYSAMVVALGLPSDGKVIACDVNIEWTNIARDFWNKAGVAEKIDLKLAPALETLGALLQAGEAETFDFAFIDADKVNYDGYYEKSLQLVRRGGLIVLDNMLFGGKVADDTIQDENTASIRALNTKLLHDNRVSISLLSIGDGLTLARKI